MADFYLKIGDTLPILDVTLKNASGTPINLTGASVQVVLRHQGTGATVTKACTLADAANGRVTYTWLANDITAAGFYDAEFRITFAGGATLTVPSNAKDNLTILASARLS